MICKKCGSTLGYESGDVHSYSISWRIVDNTCTKIPLCSHCDESFKECSPTNKEMRVFFREDTQKESDEKKRKRLSRRWNVIVIVEDKTTNMFLHIGVIENNVCVNTVRKF